MTQAKLKPSPASGHGLTDRITGEHYTAYAKGEPIEYVPALVLLKVTGNGGHDTANGRVNEVKYEAVRLEPFPYSERDDAIWRIQNLYEGRTGSGTQTILPIGSEVEERRKFQLEKIDAWADDNGHTEGDVGALWREQYAIGPMEDANYGVRADWRNASYAHLLQFSIEQGIEQPALDEDDEPSGEDADLDDDDLDTADDDPAAGE